MKSKSSAAFPLRVRDHVVGALSVYADAVGTIGAEEIALLDELAMDLGYALQMIEDRATRERAEAALAESEERLRMVVEAIPDLVWLKDPEGVYLACNRRFERFFGAEEDKIVGRTDYDFVSRELADFFRDHDRKAMAAAGPTVNEEWVTFASDGHRELLETIKTPMYDPQGRLVGVLGVGRDITGRKQAEAEQEKLLAQLSQAQKMESIGRLAGGVAHDFNNMLAAILGHAELALEKADPEQPLFDDLLEIQKAAERSADLTRQLLAFARKQKVSPRVLDLSRGQCPGCHRRGGQAFHCDQECHP